MMHEEILEVQECKCCKTIAFRRIYDSDNVGLHRSTRFSARSLAFNDRNFDRFALMLIDNVAELLLYQHAKDCYSKNLMW